MLLMPNELEEKKKQELAKQQEAALVDSRSNTEAAGSLLSPAMPLTPWEQMQEKHGTGGSLLRMLGTGLSGGILGDVLMPEMGKGGQAKYAADLALYQDQAKLAHGQKMASAYEGMLSDDDESNDLEAIRMGAIYQPDIYGPVLRDMMQGQYNPTEETMFAPDFQYNPEIKQWEMLQTGNQGTTVRTPMGEDWKPESRMPSADYLDKSINEADQRYTKAQTGASEADWILGEMDKIGSDNWTAGLQAEGSELYKKITGTGDIVTSIRKEYEGVRVRSAVQNLPPGVASDKDIELVLAPWPEGTDNYDLIRRKLEAISRIERGRAEYSRFESDYISQNGGRNGLQRAWDQTKTAVGVTEANTQNKSWSFVDEEEQ